MQALEEQIEEKLSRVLQEIELGEISCMESAVRMALYRTAVGSALWSLEEMEACQEREKESCLKRFLVWKIFSHPECTPERAERYLWDTSSQVRRMAVEYRYERLKSGWPGLDRMLLDKSRGVREYVVYILEKHGGPDYMEEHLLEDIGAQEVADAVYLSPFYFQKCFKIITGYSIGEYLRNRRLYLAGLEVLKSNTSGNEARGGGKEKVIDLAYKYRYDTPESFTRAFTRFHGVSPMQLRTQPHRIRSRYFFR